MRIQVDRSPTVSRLALGVLLPLALALAACSPPSGGGLETVSAPRAKPRAANPPAQSANTPADANNFYAGKTIRVIVATTAGSAFDHYARVLARHMPKYLPGNPNMIVENMPGAGHLIGANYLYNLAEKDGTVIGTFVEQQVLNQTIGGKGIEFDAAKFNWLGATTTVEQACLVRTDTPARITEFREMLGPNGKQAIFATTGPGGSGYEYAMLFKEVLGANIRLVTGYRGNQEVRLAIEQGEADGYCASWDAVQRGIQPWQEAKHPPFKIIVQEGDQRIPDLADVPVGHELAQTEEDRQLFRFVNRPGDFAKPYVAPPGTPPERVALLREAFMATWKDPQAIDEIAKGHVSLDPRDGAQVEAGVQAVLNTPKPIVERYVAVVGR